MSIPRDESRKAATARLLSTKWRSRRWSTRSSDGGFEQPAVAGRYPCRRSQRHALAVRRNGRRGKQWDLDGGPGRPGGTQVGFLQDTGSMSQTVYLDAGTYQVSFLAAQDTTDQTNYQEIEVLVDGAAYGTIQPVTTSYASYQSSTFAVAAGAHTIELLGVNPLGGDNTAFLDQVSDRRRQRHQRRQLRDAGIECGNLPICAHRFGLAVLGGGRHRQQRQHLYLRKSQRPRRHPGRHPAGQRQHEPIRRPACRLVQHLLPGRPM